MTQKWKYDNINQWNVNYLIKLNPLRSFIFKCMNYEFLFVNIYFNLLYIIFLCLNLKMKVISIEFRTFVIKLQFKTVLSDHSKMCTLHKPYPSHLQNNIAHIDYTFLSTYISTYMYRTFMKIVKKIGTPFIIHRML